MANLSNEYFLFVKQILSFDPGFLFKKIQSIELTILLSDEFWNYGSFVQLIIMGLTLDVYRQWCVNTATQKLYLIFYFIWFTQWTSTLVHI